MKAVVTKCIWIRHAPSWRPEGHVPTYDPDIVPDTAAATALAQMLPDDAYWHISPLRRCQQTAAQIEDILIQRFRPPPRKKTVEHQIIEQDLGKWAGAKLDDVWKELAGAPRHNFSFQTPELTPPDGESFAAQYERISLFLKNFSDKISKTEEVHAHIFFAHAHTIRAVIAYCLDLSLERALSIQIGNYSQTIFNFLPYQHAQHVGGQWQVEALNLPALARTH